MEHSLHNEYRSINKNKIKKYKIKLKKKTYRSEWCSWHRASGRAGGDVGVRAEGGDVGSRAEGGFVKLRDRVEGGFVELGEDGEFEDFRLRVWREWEW